MIRARPRHRPLPGSIKMMHRETLQALRTSMGSRVPQAPRGGRRGGGAREWGCLTDLGSDPSSSILPETRYLKISELQFCHR